MELLSGADMIARFLQDEGVEYIYGYPGGAALHIYDALFRQDKVKHILVRHEQAATHAADGYARASGKPGTVLVTSGPGATNAVTGIATAYMDSIPMVVLCGQVMSHLIGDDAFQETDIIGVTRPIVKHSFSIRHPSEIPEVLKKAYYLAATGRPGPVVVDIPKDMTTPTERYEYVYPKKVKLRSYNPVARGHTGQIKKAVELMLKARRPVFYTGGGVVSGRASEGLTDLVKRLGYPITTTLMGIGAYPQSDTQSLGWLGMHGSYEANMAMHHADLIIAIGARFDDRVTNNTSKFCPTAKIVHVDIDPSSISKTVRADVPIVGPAASVIDEMISLVQGKEVANPEALSEWWKTIDGWREERRGKLYEPSRPEARTLTGELSIYCSVTASYSFLYDLLSAFRARYPGIELKLHTGDPAQSMPRVLAGDEDMAITSRPRQLPEALAFKSLTHSPLVFIAPRDGAPWVPPEPQSPSAAQWRDVPMVLSEAGLSREVSDTWFKALGIAPRIYAQVAGHEAIVSMVGLGFGIGVVPKIVLDTSPLAERVQILPVKPELPHYDVGLCVLNRRLKSPLIAALWDEVEERI